MAQKVSCTLDELQASGGCGGLCGPSTPLGPSARERRLCYCCRSPYTSIPSSCCAVSPASSSLLTMASLCWLTGVAVYFLDLPHGDIALQSYAGLQGSLL